MHHFQVITDWKRIGSEVYCIGRNTFYKRQSLKMVKQTGVGALGLALKGLNINQNIPKYP